jgi:Predicted carbamoyl transferase, NodU family
VGFKVNGGEYKLMGLAPYGEPKYKNIILKELVDVKKDGSFRLNMKYFDYATGLKMINKKFENLFGQKTRNPKTDLITQFHMDVSASIQAVTEEIVLKLTRFISQETKSKNLCMAGGVALNCVANGKILKNKIFEKVWIQPAAGDAGGSLGAALAYWYKELKNKRDVSPNRDEMKGSYLGPSFDDNQVEKILKSVNANYKKYTEENLIELVANEINNGKTIGWFQGRMEFGPRALGSRSIIADPRSDKMQKGIKFKRLKFREKF